MKNSNIKKNSNFAHSIDNNLLSFVHIMSFAGVRENLTHENLTIRKVNILFVLNNILNISEQHPRFPSLPSSYCGLRNLPCIVPNLLLRRVRESNISDSLQSCHRTGTNVPRLWGFNPVELMAAALPLALDKR